MVPRTKRLWRGALRIYRRPRGWIRKRYRLKRRDYREYGLHGIISNGTPRTRRVYMKARRVSHPRVALERRAAVRELPDPAFPIEESRGLAIQQPGAVPGLDDVLGEVETVLGDRDLDVEMGEREHLKTDILDESALSLDSTFLRFALRDDIIASVAAYLGEVPILYHTGIWYSKAIEHPPHGTRLYHLDGDELREVKILVHCNDVNEETGPMTVFDAGTSEQVLKGLGRPYKLGTHRITDEEMRGALPEGAEETSFIGPRGTAVFVDTARCLHYGSRVEPGAPGRLLAAFHYCTAFAFSMPGPHPKHAPYRHLGASATRRLDRLVLGAD